MDEHRWELLEVVLGDLQAELLRGLLEAQEIPVLLSQEGAGRAIGLSVGPLGEVEILVRSEDLLRARQVLDEYYAGEFAGDSSGESAGQSEDDPARHPPDPLTDPPDDES